MADGTGSSACPSCGEPFTRTTTAPVIWCAGVATSHAYHHKAGICVVPGRWVTVGDTPEGSGSPLDIAHKVAAALGSTVGDILSGRRWRAVVRARHAVALVLHRAGLSYSAVARILGMGDHTTAMAACQRAEQRESAEPDFAAAVASARPAPATPAAAPVAEARKPFAARESLIADQNRQEQHMKVNGFVVPDEVVADLRRWIATHSPTQKQLVARIREVADGRARLWKLAELAPQAASKLRGSTPATPPREAPGSAPPPPRDPLPSYGATPDIRLGTLSPTALTRASDS